MADEEKNGHRTPQESVRRMERDSDGRAAWFVAVGVVVLLALVAFVVGNGREPRQPGPALIESVTTPASPVSQESAF